MDGRGHLLVSGHWSDSPRNQFRGNSDQWQETFANHLAGIDKDDMLPWVLSVSTFNASNPQYDKLELCTFCTLGYKANVLYRCKVFHVDNPSDTSLL
jgi:hypothetical protein